VLTAVKAIGNFHVVQMGGKRRLTQRIRCENNCYHTRQGIRVLADERCRLARTAVCDDLDLLDAAIVSIDNALLNLEADNGPGER